MSFLASKSVPAKPYPYTIKISRRAKYMRLRVSMQQGVVVVVPAVLSQKQIKSLVPDFVREQQLWIDSVLDKLRKESQSAPALEDCPLPERITITGLAQNFNVLYRSESDTEDLSLWQSDDFELQIKGNITNKKGVFELFEQFFKSYAYGYLQERLDRFSQQFKLPYQRLTVRAQKTRWGSCSTKQNINLNYRLIFLPEELMDYVLLHELAHIEHMNHSRDFWALLESMTSNARRKDKQLNKASKNLPHWMALT